jgi:hypothetical protein
MDSVCCASKKFIILGLIKEMLAKSNISLEHKAQTQTAIWAQALNQLEFTLEEFHETKNRTRPKKDKSNASSFIFHQFEYSYKLHFSHICK